MYNNGNKARGGLPIPKGGRYAQRRQANEDTPLFKRVLVSSLFGLVANLLVGIALVTLVCLFAYNSGDPLSLISSLALLSLLPSNFVGGFVAAKRCGGSGLACGCVSAAMWCALSLLSALCVYSVPPSGYTLIQGILLHAASGAFCILGALAGGIKRAPSRKKRRFG